MNPVLLLGLSDADLQYRQYRGHLDAFLAALGDLRLQDVDNDTHLSIAGALDALFGSMKIDCTIYCLRWRYA
jgi:hypothetical protein